MAEAVKAKVMGCVNGIKAIDFMIPVADGLFFTAVGMLRRDEELSVRMGLVHKCNRMILYVLAP